MCSTPLRCHQFVLSNLFVIWVFIKYFGVPACFKPFLSTSNWSSISQIKFLLPLGEQGSLQRGIEVRRAKTTAPVFFFPQKKWVCKEQSCVPSLEKGAPALHSVVQSLQRSWFFCTSQCFFYLYESSILVQTVLREVLKRSASLTSKPNVYH